MTKPEWGIKRLCAQCSARYYDMKKNPPVCPSCGVTFDPEALLKSRRRMVAAEPVPAPKPKKVEVEADEAEAEDIEVEDEEAVEAVEPDDVIGDDDEADIEVGVPTDEKE